MKRKMKNDAPQTAQESAPISEAEIDENLEDSFPASDPVSVTSTTHSGGPKKKRK